MNLSCYLFGYKFEFQCDTAKYHSNASCWLQLAWNEVWCMRNDRLFEPTPRKRT